MDSTALESAEQARLGALCLPFERNREEVTPEILARNPPRFAELMGENVYQYAFREEGPDYEKIARKPTGYSWWDSTTAQETDSV